MPASIISLGGDAPDFGAIEFGPGNPLRVAVAGAHGRMGSEVVKAVVEADDMVVVCEIERGEDMALALQISRAQVMVDFTVPKAVRGNMLAALEVGVVPIIGTSGINEAMMEEVRRACFTAGVGALVAPNFALGAVLMMRFARDAARYFPDAEIVEMHHEKKIDSPSGTALLTAHRIKEGRGETLPTVMPLVDLDRETSGSLPGARGASGAGDVPIHSIRLPGFVASQFVTFGGPGQTLTIRHDTIDRVSFMPGVLLALRKTEQIREARDVIYGLGNLLD